MSTQRDDEQEMRSTTIVNTALTAQELETLLQIAEEASKGPLLYGEPHLFLGSIAAVERMKTIRGYLNRRKGEDYLILVDGTIAGYASIWDGWLAVLSEYERPQVELAFIDPKYEQWRRKELKKAFHWTLDDLAKG